MVQTIVDIDSTETVKFHWKVSCQTSYNNLRFSIDDTVPACDICSKSLLAGRSKGSGPVIWIIAVVGRYFSR